MVVLLLIAFLRLLAVNRAISIEEIPDLCPTSAITDLTGEIPDKFGIIRKSGRDYPPYSRWLQDGVLIGCDIKIEKPRLPLCCPPESVMNSEGGCSEEDPPSLATLPSVYTLNRSTDGVEANPKIFDMVVSNICDGLENWILDPEDSETDYWYLTRNGSIYVPNDMVKRYDFGSYCLFREVNSTGYMVVHCVPDEYSPVKNVGMLISVPFLVATFIAYTILPEMRNIHGLTISMHVGCLAVSYLLFGLTNVVFFPDSICLVTSFTIHFSFLASFFWLNVMCFDIWWTFGGFRSLQGSIKQRERKKFLMYSIYAWGCAAILTAVCLIMDFVPGIPDGILRPEFGAESCWFKTEEAKALYFYGPMGITVICNIVLFISTAAKIIQHKKDTAHHLKGTDSKRHDDNKQWFNLYLKLFIVMGINWSMEIISWLCQGPKSLWYLTDIANSLQGVIIFIIFVWKQKIKRLLMKRFGCQGNNFLSRDSTRSANHSSSSRTCTTSIPLHEKMNQFPDPVSRATKNVSDDSDGA